MIQDSGYHGRIESVDGSIQIVRSVEVEAVSVRGGSACYFLGSVTA